MPTALDQIFAELQKRSGVDLSRYRSGTLHRRLKVRMARLGLIDEAAYLQTLRSDPAESGLLLETIGVHVSSFFRDPMVYDLLERRYLPELMEGKRQQGRKELRFWSAGCACGEEAYSLAILCHELRQKDPCPWSVHIFASDISHQSLERARAGSYLREALETTRLGRVQRYFLPEGNAFSVVPHLRQGVHFCHHDLTGAGCPVPTESIFGTFDLILCRNVLIYFRPELQSRVLARLCSALSDHGYLVLGPAESMHPDLGKHFQTLDEKNRIWKKIPVGL